MTCHVLLNAVNNGLGVRSVGGLGRAGQRGQL